MQQSFTGLSAQNHAQAVWGTVHGNVIFGGDSSSEPTVEKQAKDCRNALFVTDVEIDRQTLITTKGERVAGTCEWIREDPKYQEWLRGDSKLLWISGGPGKGKTMMSIFLTQELECVTHESESSWVMYYFCSNDDERRNNATVLLRGLLWQVLRMHPSLVEHMSKYFETPERTRSSLASLETLWTMFQLVVHDRKLSTTTCVIDGLDECDKVSQAWLIKKFTGLWPSGYTAPNGSAFRLSVVSRPISGLERCAQVRLDPDNDSQVSSDIRIFIFNRVHEFSAREFGEDFNQYLEEELLRRANGTFLWVGFAVSELLEKQTATEIIETLQGLPEGLPAIYRRMLLQINPRYRDICASILRWLTLSVRPMSLEELAAAVGIQAKGMLTTRQAMRDHITLCGPLLSVQEGLVGLVHQSASDYLLQEDTDGDPIVDGFRIRPEEGHLQLAKVCLDCIQQSGLPDRDLENRGHGNTHLGAAHQQRYPLLHYAVYHWPAHAKSCSALASALLDHPSDFFLDDSGLREQWWTVYRSIQSADVERQLLPSLHMACFLGNIPWIESCLQRIECEYDILDKVNQTDLPSGSPLHYASAEGHEAVVRLLLDNGAKLEARNIRKKTALHLACDRGKEAVIRLLLSCGANIEARDVDGWTALRNAILNRDESVIRLLLDHGADVEARTARGEEITSAHHEQTALHSAVSLGELSLVRILLDYGADPEARDGTGRTALRHAAFASDEPLIQLLLDRGADIEARDGRGWTALHFEARWGDVSVLRLLLDCGADIEARDRKMWTALHVAAVWGEESAIQILLDRGADIGARDCDGWTALHLVADLGNVSALRLLLDNGADLAALDEDGLTAIELASQKDHRSVVQLLLERGAKGAKIFRIDSSGDW